MPTAPLRLNGADQPQFYLMDRRRPSPPPRTILCAWRDFPQPSADPTRTPVPTLIILADRRWRSGTDRPRLSPALIRIVQRRDVSIIGLGTGSRSGPGNMCSAAARTRTAP